MSLSLDLTLRGRHHAFGAAAAPQKIGGVAIGDTGEGIFENLKLVAGDDFDTPPTRWTPKNESGKYAHSALTIGFRRTSVTDNVFYIDPAFRGARSESAVDLGIDRVAVANSILTLTASAPEAELLPYLPSNYGSYGDANGKPRFISGSLKTAPYVMLSAQSDWAVEIYAKTKAGDIKGYWPSFWTSTFFWPDYGEVDIVEAKKSGSQTKNSQNVHVSQTDGAGDNGVTALPLVNIPDRFIRFVARKIGNQIKFYDDIDIAGTLAWRGSATNYINRIRGAHDIRLDLAVSNLWDGSTYSYTNYPATYEIDWFRVWTPATGGNNSAVEYLPEINISAGGSWAATLPSAALISGGKPGIEQVFGVFDNTDAVGQSGRNTTTKLPAGAAWNSTTRAISGVVPTTEGGRVYIGMTYAFDDGTPAKRIFQPYNIAPVQQSSFENLEVAFTRNFNIAVPYSKFHSGNLGHIYNVTCNKAWVIIDGNNTSALNLSGTSPSADDVATITINAVNSKGQATQSSFTITAALDSILELDKFENPINQSILTYTPIIGGAWQAHVSVPDALNYPVILNGLGSAFCPNNYTKSALLYYKNSTLPDTDYSVKGSIIVKSVVSGDQIGICGRMSNTALTYYLARKSGSSVQLYKSVAGTLTSLGSYAVSWAAGETHEIELKMLGTTISVNVDGTERISVTDNSITAAGRAGVRFYNDTAATPTTGLHLDEFTAI